jgi:cytochrome b subunit of formate dehydrogenase
MNERRRARAEFRRNLIGIAQVLFAALIFIIFFLAFIIQSGAIVLPQWTKTFQGVSPAQQAEFAAALLSVILVVTAIIVVAGIYLARSNVM